MRVLLAVALLATGCSYGFDDLHPSFERYDSGVDAPRPSADPRNALDPAWPCNPVSSRGCSVAASCLGEVSSGVAVTDLRCVGGFGSGVYGTYCVDRTFCVSQHLCWTDPATPGATEGTCGEPCFDDTDCTPGFVCDVGSAYRAPFAGTTLYRCVPDGG